jgi:hypothetical protein
MNRRAIWVWLLLFALLPTAAFAEHTRYWTETDFTDFDKGNADGVALRSDGKLMPAPQFSQFADPNLAFLWALRTDSHGRLYAAGGSDAKVLRVDNAGKSTVVFESSELEAQALAIDSKDNLYVGTSPDGKVYKVTPDGQKSVFFDPQAKYIWGLAFDKEGNLFVATGDQGEVFVVGPDGKGQRFYQSHERHARSLAFDGQGNLLIGTEPDGLILRVNVKGALGSLPAAASAFVIFETSKAEVTSLAVDAGGNIYASSVGDKVARSEAPRIPASAPQQPLPANGNAGANAAAPGQGGIVIVQSATPSPQPAINFGGPSVSAGHGAEVVKIAPDGSPQVLWTTRESLVFSVAVSPQGRVLLGTGDEGNLIELEGDGVYSRVAKTASAQVTSLAGGTDGRVFVATANPGKIFVVGPGYQSNGNFQSNVFDAKIFSHWGRLAWYGQNDPGVRKVEFYVRSGNTSNPDDTWSAWAGPYSNPGGDPVNAPASRFAQWKAVFLDMKDGVAPEISWVSLAYQPKNVPPVIDDVVVQNPGIRVSGFVQSLGPSSPTNAQLRYPRTENSAAVQPASDNPPMRVEVPPQGAVQKGYESVLWSAHDDNDDDLVFSIYYRGEGEKNWRLLKDKITQHFYSWDSTSMPDGAYYLKVVASDSPSNPLDQALQTERESDRWEIANTPPKIENLHAGQAAPATVVSFDAISASGPIAHAQYSVDAGDWQVVFPTGLLSDAPKESYSIGLNNLSPGEHTLAVQVSDRYDNTASGKVTFTIPLRASQ